MMRNNHRRDKKQSQARLILVAPITISIILTLIVSLSSCARMGAPDGGWFDENPPRVINTTPNDGGVNVKEKKISIYFDEFVNISNPTENVVISPPQLEAPDIKSMGKKIIVNLKDSLKENTTYTVDFSDAITDNNEGNPLGNYTYSFSTGDSIDTFQVSGYVLEAENLEPLAGIMVGLYADLSDSAFKTKPMLRVSRADSRGHFVIKGVAKGKYHVVALKDADGDFRFTQKAEEIAFLDDVIEPTTAIATRQDTIWKDSLHIDNIVMVDYTDFLPNDIVLRAFTHQLTDRYFVKQERKEPDHFTLYFTYGSNNLPKIEGLNFKSDNAFILEPSPRGDTITYWLKDTNLINTDSLELALTYDYTDTLGEISSQTDTLLLLPKLPYERRMKLLKKQIEDWQKAQEKAKKKGQPYDSVYPKEAIKMNVNAPQKMDPDNNVSFTFSVPLAKCDTSKIHLYSEYDSLWYIAPFELVDGTDTLMLHNFPQVPSPRKSITLRANWRPDIQYSLELDSAAFVDIYGHASKPMKSGMKVRSLDDYSTLLLTIQGMKGKHCIVQLLNKNGGVVKSIVTDNGNAEFFYINPETYYLRLIVDENRNNKWDEGDYGTRRQPEMVYYYDRKIECKAKWDITEMWNPTALPIYKQKPGEITKQKKQTQKRTLKSRNLERAKRLGVEYVEKAAQK